MGTWHDNFLRKERVVLPAKGDKALLQTAMSLFVDTITSFIVTSAQKIRGFVLSSNKLFKL